MTPRLYSIAGPVRGSSTPLGDNDFHIGRERSNELAIPDPDLSRRHCVIRKKTNEYVLVDLGSRNGVFVNSVPVRERVLRHGDQIEAGASCFVFLTEEDEESTVTSEGVRPMATGSLLTTRWNQEENTPRSMSRVELLLKVSEAINRIQDLRSLGEKLLELVFEVVPADAGALLVPEPAGELKAAGALSRIDPSQPMQVIREIVDRAVYEKSAVLATQVQQGDTMRTSVCCAPLVLYGEVAGALYLETRGAERKIAEGDLPLIRAIANLSAPAVRNCSELRQWKERSRELQSELRMRREIVGESPAMKAVLSMVRKISAADTTVLIVGESGTGKELVAQAIHANSPRAEYPFLAINCAALPDSLLESELFGYEKGAFTGATAQKKGKIEVAAGGTLFLDEIAELAPQLQAKLLRFLQEREFERLGGNRVIKVDVRVLAATNRKLETYVADGKFRQDLYYRLNVVQVAMPPLRALGEDIGLLASYFISRFQHKLGRRVKGISPEARRCLAEYDWPGNVRELENVIERGVLLGTADMIVPEDLPESLLANLPSAEGGTFHEAVAECKKKIIRKALQDAGNNYAEAAAKLKIHPTHLYRLVRMLKMDDGQ